MHKKVLQILPRVFFVVCCAISCYCDAMSGKSFSQPLRMRQICKEAQLLERSIGELERKMESLVQRENIFSPIVRNVCEILSRCCTLLVNMKRFSELLILIQRNDKNDFVRCSIVIRNFTSYFKSVNAKLEKDSGEIFSLKKEKLQLGADIDEKKNKYEILSRELDRSAGELAKTRRENSIQNDIVWHIASKSESLEELDAELEAENVIGVLRNTKVFSGFSMSFPVAGKIVMEFGDKGKDGEMAYHTAIMTRTGAVVTSPANGFVVFTGKFLSYGNMLIISNGDNRVFMYGMATLFVNTGDTLEVGDYIGRMGEGAPDDVTIKVELKKSGEPLDPRPWLLQSLEKEGSK
jgi:septal ring factor EnvC (AmiA/AmiB activator)